MKLRTLMKKGSLNFQVVNLMMKLKAEKTICMMTNVIPLVEYVGRILKLNQNFRMIWRSSALQMKQE